MTRRITKNPTAIDPERLEKLAGLFHLRWNVPLIASMGENPVLGRVAVLAKRLDVGRSTVHRALRVLQERGWVQVNPGFGHPLRPEFILSATGQELSPWCLEFQACLRRRRDVERLAYQKWSMAVLWLVGNRQNRFALLEKALPGISPRALSQALKALCAAELLRRTIADEMPVRIEYRPTRRGRSLVSVLDGFFA